MAVCSGMFVCNVHTCVCIYEELVYLNYNLCLFKFYACSNLCDNVNLNMHLYYTF